MPTYTHLSIFTSWDMCSSCLEASILDFLGLRLNLLDYTFLIHSVPESLVTWDIIHGHVTLNIRVSSFHLQLNYTFQMLK